MIGTLAHEGAVASRTAYAPPDRSSDQEIEQAWQMLCEETVLSRMLDAMPELVMVLNQHRQIVFGNRALAVFAAAQGRSTFLGLRPGELLACQVSQRAPSGCGTGPECRTCGAVNVVLESLAGSASTQECRINSDLGGKSCALDLRVCGTPFEWRGQTLVLFVATDISDTKRRRVLERLFFHDILNSAGNIRGIADILATDRDLLPEMIEALKLSSEELLNEIHSQRTLLAAESEELAVDPRPLTALEVLNSVVSSTRNHPVALEKQVAVAASSSDFAFVSDPALLHRVLVNLVKNGLEASRRGETATLGCGCAGNEVWFWCHNDACMPRAVQLQMFQRSFSTKGVGRGIGTYSVKLLTERYLKGQVSFVSEPETGTVFTVTLPVDGFSEGEK